MYKRSILRFMQVHNDVKFAISGLSYSKVEFEIRVVFESLPNINNIPFFFLPIMHSVLILLLYFIQDYSSSIYERESMIDRNFILKMRKKILNTKSERSTSSKLNIKWQLLKSTIYCSCCSIVLCLAMIFIMFVLLIMWEHH